MHASLGENKLISVRTCILELNQCYTTVAVACFKIKKRSQSPDSVDESLPVSSGLFNLVIVLVNDVKQHRLQREKESTLQDEITQT